MGGKKRTPARPAAETPAKRPKLASGAVTANSRTQRTKKPHGTYEAIPVDEKEEAFPRGGKQLLTPLEKVIIEAQAKQDVLFDEVAGGGHGDSDDEDGDGVEDGNGEQLAIARKGKSATKPAKVARIDILNVKKVVPGMLLLGAVLEIHEYLVVFSLPFNMRGTVAISDVSAHITELAESEAEHLDENEQVSGESRVPLMERLFSVGQMMPCIVQAVEKGRVNLSVNPQLVNSHLVAKDIKPKLLLSCCVKSVEDHGYIVDFGVEKKGGFLLKKNSAEFAKHRCKGKSLCVGQVVQCMVLAGPDTRTVPVSVNPSDVDVAVMSSEHVVGVGSLLPGQLVKTAVKEVASNGLIVNFLDGLTGTVAPQHLSSSRFFSPEKYKPNKKLKARLLWVDVAVKKMGVTLQQELVEGRCHDFEGMEIGTCYDDVKVVHMDHLSGLYLELANGRTGYVPPWMVMDNKPASAPIKEKKQYRKGSTHQARVCQFNRIDGLVVLSLQKSVLEKPYMNYSSVGLGDRVGGVVERVCPFGMIISVTETIRGLCPRHHVSDTKTITLKPGKKYKEGSEVKCRVINVDPAHKRMMLTCKKSLLRESGGCLSEYSSAVPGARFCGVITSIHPYGCIVHFFGQVKGLVRKADLGVADVADPALAFWVGQPVECRVLECDTPTQRLLLSFVLDPSQQATVLGANSLKSGAFVDAEVTGIASNGISLKCVGESDEVVFLPTLHLSDYPHHCSLLLSFHQTQLEKALKEKHPYVLHDLLVVCGKLGHKQALVTMKQAMTSHMRKNLYISTVTDFKVGTVLPGFVRNIQPYGCFIDFPHQLTGLAHLKHLSDQFVSQPSEVYQETQTVWAKVLSLDDSAGKVSLSLRPSDLKIADLAGDGAVAAILSLFHVFVTERSSILESMKCVKGRTTARSVASLARAFVPGGRVTGHVTSFVDDGGHVTDHVTSCADDSAIVELEGGVNGVIVRASLHGANLEVGSEVACSILDIDLVECRLVLSRNPNVLLPPPCSPVPSYPVTRSRTAERKKRKSALVVEEVGLSPGSSVVGLVEHKTPYYLVLSCSTLSGCKLAYGLMNTGQLGVLPSSFHHLRVGQQVIGTVQSWSSEQQGGLPVVMVTDVLSKSKSRGVQDSSCSLADPVPTVQVGEVLSFIVQNVKSDQVDVKYRLWRGRVHCTLAKEMDSDVLSCGGGVSGESSKVFSGLSVGDVVKARVVKVREKNILRQGSKKGATVSVLELTTRPSLLESAEDLDAECLMKKVFREGEEVNAVVWQVSEKGLSVHLTPHARGFVPLMCISNDIKVLKDIKHHHYKGQVVRCTVTGEGSGSVYNISMIGAVASPCEGSMVLARIHNFILGRAIMMTTPTGVGRVDITDISDTYQADPFQELRQQKKEGVIMECHVVGVDGGRWDLSLRGSRLGQTEEVRDPEICDVGGLVEGGIVRGYVKSVTDFGVYVRLGRNVDGRVQITHLADGFVKEFKALYSVGDLVTAKILKVDRVKGKVDLSLRLSQVDPEAAKRKRRKSSKKSDKTTAAQKKKKLMLSSDGESPEELVVHTSASDVDESASDHVTSDEDSSDDGQSDDNETDMGGKAVARATLHVGGGFRWDVNTAECPEGGVAEKPASSDSEADEVDNVEVTSRQSSRQKRAVRKAEEVKLYQKERLLLETGRVAESADDFERLLLTTPNDSSLWVQYMAFHLHTAEVDKARGVAQRALSTISFRETAEKLNVWVGWLNLENLYGSEDTLGKVFESALQQNEPIEVYRRLVTVYVQSSKHELATKLYQTMTKKFAGTQWVWSQYATFLMKQGRQTQARGLLQRALKALSSKQDHVSLISKFSQLEFKYGESERGKTMFESLLSTYPKRVDLWSVYIDMMLKTGDKERVRDIFERAIHLKISAKKMKFLFKRYLEFEREHGDQTLIDLVIEKARSFVESLSTSTTS